MLKQSKSSIYKKNKIKKSQCQLWHAKKRAKERLGIVYTDELNSQIIACIKNNKSNDNFTVSFLENQSKRLGVYELKLKSGTSINLIYDNFRNQVITFLFPEDKKNIYFYYDIFQNKISTKHVYGRIWKLQDTELDIPGEKVIYNNGVWYVEEGTLKGKKFKLDHDDLIELI